jgi:hypothetical protein
MASTYPSLMKATCKSCGVPYMKNPERWALDSCPVCTVSAAMRQGFMPGTDAVFYSKIDMFFVVRVPTANGYRLTIYDNERYSKYLKHVPNAMDHVFRGPMRECVDYLKNHK